MGIIECTSARCKPGICQLYGKCETQAKYGDKPADLSPLEQAQEEQRKLKAKLELLEKQIAVRDGMVKTATFEAKTLIATPIVTETKKPVGRPKKNG